MKQLAIAILIVFTLSSADCYKNKTDSDELPPATQEGKNKIGFLLNGQVYTPKGYNGTSNLSIDVDYGFRTGIFNIAAYRTINSITEQFTIGISDSLNLISIPYTFKIRPQSVFGVSYTKGNCDYFSKDNTTSAQGKMTITKLDKTNRIISGIFDASLNKTSCEPITISEGRFDMKY
jgi:hypothetical protein